MKHHLRHSLGTQIAIYEELCTLLSEREACLNSRPLCALSNDPLDPSHLSPGHFLIGEPLTKLPSTDHTNVKYSMLSRWQTFQQQVQHFWQHWLPDYLMELQQWQHWQRSSPNNPQPGDVILLKDDTAPLHWPLAIINVHPANDGTIQVVTLKSSKGAFKRLIAKICPLPLVNVEFQFFTFWQVPVC
jgi:hypothetical protein